MALVSIERKTGIPAENSSDQAPEKSSFSLLLWLLQEKQGKIALASCQTVVMATVSERNPQRHPPPSWDLRFPPCPGL